eukprot:10925761-Alexandrium_andersonii.AAC.1
MERRSLGKCFDSLGPPKRASHFGPRPSRRGLPFGDLGPEVPKYALLRGCPSDPTVLCNPPE